MSDEEKRDDVYIRHQPDYRSEKFTAFLNKLDERSSRKQSSHARYERSIGTPIKKTLPAGIPRWLTNSTSEPSVQEDSPPDSPPDTEHDENTSSDDSDHLF